MTAKTFGAAAPLLVLSLVACSGTVDPNAIERPIEADASAPDAASSPPDASLPTDVPSAPDAPVALDAPVTPDAPRPDAAADAPRLDATVTPDVPPIVDAPPPPDVAPPDAPPVCRACTPFGPVEFCPGTGSAACLTYASCIDNCVVCAPALRGGDGCGPDVPVITRRGRSRTVLTTCGATDNLNTGCGRTGPDMVFAVQVSTTGRVAFTYTAPAGVNLYVGFDSVGGTTCRSDSAARTCTGTSPSNERSSSATLPSGTYYIYITTSAPSTIVVDAELP